MKTFLLVGFVFYNLTKFRIKVIELENEPFEMNHAEFAAVSENGVKYENFISVASGTLDLRTDLYEGAEFEDYTYFGVEIDDESLAVFNQQRDDEVWFDRAE